MKITTNAIHSLSRIVTGDEDTTPKLSGAELVAFFKYFGINDKYKRGLPDGLNRNEYAEFRLNTINGTNDLSKLLNELVSKRHFNKCDFNNKYAIKDIDAILEVEGYAYVFLDDSFQITKVEN